MKERTCVLGVDFGTHRVGLAVSDPDRKIAFPLAIHTRTTPERDAQHFQELTAGKEISRIVVGLPVHTGGEEGQKAREARRFGQWLRDVTGLPVVYWDERFTTREAERILRDAGLSGKRRRERRDKLAAQILLQSFLDAGCPEDPGELRLDEPAP